MTCAQRICPARLVGIALVLAMTVSGSVQAVESEDIPATGESEAMREAEGRLKLNMRQDGADYFIFPSFFDANKTDTPFAQTDEMVRYKAIEKERYIIADVMIEVLDPEGNVDWSSDDLGKTDDVWKDSGFEGRTNYTRAANGSQDADNRPNEVQGLFKFIDPGSSGKATFKARLTITLTTGKTLVAEHPFQARVRTVAAVDESSLFGVSGKAWIWKEYALSPGDPPMCRDAKQNNEKLFVSYNTNIFGFAYERLTPRGTLYSIHHGSPTGFIYLGPAHQYSGFRWGAGSPDLLDVSVFAHAHGADVDFIHCYSAKDGAGAAKSLFDCLANHVGERTRVAGYTQDVYTHFGSYSYHFVAKFVDPPEDSEYFEKNCLKPAIVADLQRQEVVGAEGVLKWEWIRDRSIEDVESDVDYDESAIQQDAVQRYNEKYPCDEVEFDSLQVDFDYNVEAAYLECPDGSERVVFEP